MKAKRRLEQLKQQFERLRKDSIAAVGTANEGVYAGLQQFADKELKALHDYYDSALAALHAHKDNGTSIKAALQSQFDLLQDTFTRLVAHARESVETATAIVRHEAPKAKAAAKDAKSSAKPATPKPSKKPATKEPRLTMKKPVTLLAEPAAPAATEAPKASKKAVKKAPAKTAAKKAAKKKPASKPAK